MKRFYAALLCVLLGSVSASGEKPGEWRSLQTDHFHLLSNGAEGATRQLGERLERYRRVLHRLFPRWRLDPPPLSHVFVFQDWESYRPYVLRGPDGQPLDVGGFMTAMGTERAHIAVNLEAVEAESSLIHEYTHLAVRLNFPSLPLWLQEGLAGLFEHSSLDPSRLTLGRMKAPDWDLLKNQERYPLEKLIRMDPTGGEWESADARHIFYAQSVLVVQYLFVAEHGRYRSPFLLFLRLLQEGAAETEALKLAFRTDWGSLEKPLEEYLKRLTPETMQIDVPPGPPESTPQLKVLTAAQTEAHLAELWLTLGRTDEAEAVFRHLVAEGKADADLRYLLGQVALDRYHAREAETHFRAALAMQPDAPHLRYFTARAFFGGRLGDLRMGEELRSAMDEMVGLLEPLLAEPVKFPDAYRLLLQARYIRGDTAEDLIPLAEKARRALPQTAEIDRLLGQLYAREEFWEEAQQAFRRLLSYAETEKQKAEAEEWLDFLRARLGEGTYDREPREEEEVPLPREMPSSPEGIRYARGILAEVTCQEERNVLLLHVDGGEAEQKMLRLAELPGFEPLLFDRTGRGQDIGCHTAGISVGVHYLPVAGESPIAGTVLTIETYPRTQ